MLTRRGNLLSFVDNKLWDRVNSFVESFLKHLKLQHQSEARDNTTNSAESSDFDYYIFLPAKLLETEKYEKNQSRVENQNQHTTQAPYTHLQSEN